MPFAVMRRKYPLLKFTIPLALLVAAVGLFLFFSQSQPLRAGCTPSADDSCKDGLDPMVLLPWLIAAAVVAFVGVLVRSKQAIEVPLPSDHIKQASRSEVDGILATLDEARARGDMSETRYNKAKAKVLAQAKAKK